MVSVGGRRVFPNPMDNHCRHLWDPISEDPMKALKR